jgi:hypothetical protein
MSNSGSPNRSLAFTAELPAASEEGPAEPSTLIESPDLKGVNVFFLHGIFIRR